LSDSTTTRPVALLGLELPLAGDVHGGDVDDTPDLHVTAGRVDVRVVRMLGDQPQTTLDSSY
jgi:hypothetical protein